MKSNCLKSPTFSKGACIGLAAMTTSLYVSSDGNRGQVLVRLPVEAQEALVHSMATLSASLRLREDLQKGLAFIFKALRGTSLGPGAHITVRFEEGGVCLELHFHGSRCAIYPDPDFPGTYIVKDSESPALAVVANLAAQVVLRECLRGIVEGYSADTDSSTPLVIVEQDVGDELKTLFLIRNRSGECVGWVRSSDLLHIAENLILKGNTDLYLEEISPFGEEHINWFMHL